MASAFTDTIFSDSTVYNVYLTDSNLSPETYTIKRFSEPIKELLRKIISSSERVRPKKLYAVFTLFGSTLLCVTGNIRIPAHRRPNAKLVEETLCSDENSINF